MVTTKRAYLKSRQPVGSVLIYLFSPKWAVLQKVLDAARYPVGRIAGMEIPTSPNVFRKWHLRILRWRILLRSTSTKNTENQPTASPELPWYESTLLWGAFTVVIGLITTYAGFATKDIRWFLVAAWPFCCLVALPIAKAISKRHKVLLF
jgi:hypothetical protein